MNKYVHVANLDNVVVVRKLLHFMRLIQQSFRYEYCYYVTGEIKTHKIANVINKFDQYYNVCENSLDRKRRHQLNQATVKLIMFYPDNSNVVYYILLARCGCNGSKGHIFFSAEKYKDATNKNESLTINHYVLKRVNKERYLFDEGEDSTKVIAGKNEV